MVIRRLLLSAALLLGAAMAGRAQTVAYSGGNSAAAHVKTFIICMPDTNIIRRSEVYPHPIISYRPQVQAILNNYTVYSIEKAYPVSRLLVTRSYYRIRANSLNLLQDLLAYSGGLFPTGFEEPGATPLYEPLEFFNGSGCDTFLRYIRANQAWNYTQGNPDVVIGMSDTYFDLSNPDLAGRIANVRVNSLPPIGRSHGTEVAGFAVCNTDDAQLAGVGWNCRLDVSSLRYDAESLAMSAGDANRPPRKILNASWQYNGSRYSCGEDYSTHVHVADLRTGQNLYNEVYENGTFAVFPAGNSGRTTPDCGNFTGDSAYIFEEADVQSFVFPASFDHVFSVSGVGFNPNHTANINPINNTWGNWNWSDMHCFNAQDPATAVHHNNKVDLLAPAYLMPALYFDPNEPNKRTTPLVFGTSYASPMVAGTAGLMQSVSDQCLSPYQLEYVLKTTANTNVFNQPENAAYAGMLGAGTLNAGAAVEMVVPNPFTEESFCNDPATQTFVVKGIEVNTICAPGYASNGVLPKLRVVLENGTPPYTYKWMPEYGLPNSGTLDAYDIAEPTVVAAYWDPPRQKFRCLYRVTVTDASPVPKIANGLAVIYFDTSGYDIAMRDGGMDMFLEPYEAGLQDTRQRIWWSESDIWNRRTPDGGLEHQNPEYYDTDSNYLYTRIRNVGCAASPSTAKLRLYWTIQSTGEDWDEDWTVANFNGDPNLPAGRELTQAPMPIPALQPGEEVIMVHGWRSQRPALYGDNLTELNACVLARIEESPGYPFGMTFPEVTGVGVGKNVTNNNNIITRNLTFVDLLPGNEVPENLVIVANPEGSMMTYTLRLDNNRVIFPHLSGDFSAIGFVRIKLGQELYERWMKAGGKGKYAAADDRTYIVEYDGSGTLRLEGITLEAHEHIPIRLQFLQREGRSPQVWITASTCSRRGKSQTPNNRAPTRSSAASAFWCARKGRTKKPSGGKAGLQ